MNGKKLTAAAQDDRDSFEAEDGCCSCHIAPPCGFCIHPGNPENQEEDAECWEDDIDDDIDDLFDRTDRPERTA